MKLFSTGVQLRLCFIWFQDSSSLQKPSPGTKPPLALGGPAASQHPPAPPRAGPPHPDPGGTVWLAAQGYLRCLEKVCNGCGEQKVYSKLLCIVYTRQKKWPTCVYKVKRLEERVVVLWRHPGECWVKKNAVCPQQFLHLLLQLLLLLDDEAGGLGGAEFLKQGQTWS